MNCNSLNAPHQAERPDVLALLNKVTMARQKTEELQQQRNDPLGMSSPETAALSPLSHAEVELLRHIRVRIFLKFKGCQLETLDAPMPWKQTTFIGVINE